MEKIYSLPAGAGALRPIKKSRALNPRPMMTAVPPLRVAGELRIPHPMPFWLMAILDDTPLNPNVLPARLLTTMPPPRLLKLSVFSWKGLPRSFSAM